MSRRRTALTVAALLAVCAALPFAGAARRSSGAARCDYDGVVLASRHTVGVNAAAGEADFCCVSCAEAWIAAESAVPMSIRVTDESSGTMLDARQAFFVRSRVVSVPETDDRTHVFALEVDAAKHADAYRGRMLVGDERPFGAFPTDR